MQNKNVPDPLYIPGYVVTRGNNRFIFISLANSHEYSKVYEKPMSGPTNKKRSMDLFLIGRLIPYPVPFSNHNDSIVSKQVLKKGEPCAKTGTEKNRITASIQMVFFNDNSLSTAGALNIGGRYYALLRSC